jgi:hypothetical protein
MLGLAPISAVPVSALDTHTYVVVPNPSGSYASDRGDKRKLYVIDGNKVYLNKTELQRAMDAMRQETPVADVEVEVLVEDAVPYQQRANELEAFMAQQAQLAAQQAEIQRRLAIQAAAEQEILARWMEERRRDEEEALLVLL